MKKLILIAALALFTLGAGTGCEVNNGGGAEVFSTPVIVAPGAWREMPAGGGRVEFMYADIEVPALTSDVLANAIYTTYFKYMDGNEPVQEPLPILNLDDLVDITSEYTIGHLRIVLRPHDHLPYYPQAPMSFRLGISY